MSVSHSKSDTPSTHAKKSSSKSNHHPATPEATRAPASTSSAPSAPEVATALAATPASASPPLTRAKEALAQLDTLESKLNLDIVIRPNDKNQIRALNRVTDKALSLAADVVSSDPARFTDFAGLPASAAYVQAMAPVAARAATLAGHLQKSVQNQRSPAAQQTLALYSVAKGLGRITGNETMREKVALLKAEIAPKRANAAPKETKAEKALKKAALSKTARIERAMKVLAAEGALPSTAPTPAAAPVTSAASSPHPSPAASSVSFTGPAPVAVPVSNGAAAPTPATSATN